jgi:hypothetical protein
MDAISSSFVAVSMMQTPRPTSLPFAPAWATLQEIVGAVGQQAGMWRKICKRAVPSVWRSQR